MQNFQVACAFKGCKSSWHYPCGTRNACKTVFYGKFESYCSKHVPDPNRGKRHGTEYCLVCFSVMGTYNHADSIIGSCCLKLPDWKKCFIHKKCAMSYTKNAGYDSTCINCPMKSSSKEKWQMEMRKKGVFVPWQSAAWEKEDYFKDHVKNKCEDPSCPKPWQSSNVWTCFVCGCFPRHLTCAKVYGSNEYYCPKCHDQSFIQRVPKL